MFESVREFFTSMESDPVMTGQVRRVRVPVDKDWEIASVMRKCILNYPEEHRPGLLFENVKGYGGAVMVGVYINRKKYAYALGVEPDALLETWVRALSHPVPPRLLASGRCKQVILRGDDADLTKYPIPVWTPGEDPGPYITAGCVITKDPDTGRTNVGTYRMQVKGGRITGIGIGTEAEGTENHHLVKYWSRGEPMQAAVVIGPDPVVNMVSVSPLAYDDDELAVAGGLMGRPLDVVRCETVDLEVPANAEIVLEGVVEPGVLEHEGPFGEYFGYVGPTETSPLGRPVFRIQCITQVERPLWHAYISQKPPSESSNIRGIAHAAMLYRYLRYDRGYENVLDVHFTDNWNHALIKLAVQSQDEVNGILEEASRFKWRRASYSIVTAVDDDIDIRDWNEVDWALCTRVQPHQDITVREDAGIRVRPFFGELTAPEKEFLERNESARKSSIVLINATRKWAYPPTALPSKRDLERVTRRWPEYGI